MRNRGTVVAPFSGVMVAGPAFAEFADLEAFDSGGGGVDAEGVVMSGGGWERGIRGWVVGRGLASGQL